MKRLAISLEAIAGRNNLLLAVHKAARGKRQHHEIAHFLANLEAQLAQLAASIQNGSAPTGQYRSFTIHDPKRRQIHAACFADRVLHHAILNLAEPRFETMLVDTSYACRPGKGDWRKRVRAVGLFPSAGGVASEAGRGGLVEQRLTSHQGRKATTPPCGHPSWGGELCMPRGGGLLRQPHRRTCCGATDNAHSALAHCHSIGFRKNYWAQQKSGYDNPVSLDNAVF